MKYLFMSEESRTHYLPNLLKELGRFDIRAEFSCYAEKVNEQNLALEDLTFLSKGQFQKCMAEREIDVALVFGGSLSFGQINRLKKSGTILIYFQLPELELSNNHVAKLSKMYDYVLLTLPLNRTNSNNVYYIGCPIADDIRAHSFNHVSNSALSSIGICGKEIGIKKLGKVLKSKFPDSKLIFLNESSNTQSLEILKNVNVAITFTRVDELRALLLNCPQIRYVSNSLFGPKEHAIINRLQARPIIKELSNTMDIIADLKRILYDHQYCAGIMQGYQIVKDIIGLEPSYRKAAQKIIELAELER